MTPTQSRVQITMLAPRHTHHSSHEGSNSVARTSLPTHTSQTPTDGSDSVSYSLLFDRVKSHNIHPTNVLIDLREIGKVGCHIEDGQFKVVYMGGPSIGLKAALPELEGKRDVYDALVIDLYNRGLVSADKTVLHAAMSYEGVVTSRTTELGKRFLKYTGT